MANPPQIHIKDDLFYQPKIESLGPARGTLHRGDVTYRLEYNIHQRNKAQGAVAMAVPVAPHQDKLALGIGPATSDRLKEIDLTAWATSYPDKARIAALRSIDPTEIIDGLAQLTAAITAQDRYVDDELNDGARPPKRPENNIAALENQYPAAAAYLTANSWSQASHDVKATAGQKAVDRILSGDDPEDCITEMQAKWEAHAKAHMWD